MSSQDASVRSGSSRLAVPRTALRQLAGNRWLRLHPAGLLLGTVYAMLAMTPSLIPRDWLFQGLVSGLAAASGYGMGVVIAWLLRRWPYWRRLSSRVRRTLPPWLPSAAWAALLLLVPVGLVTGLVVGAGWQRELTALMGMEQTTTAGWLRAGPLLLAVLGVAIAIARGVRRLARLAGRLLRRLRFPGRIASIGGAVLAGLLVFTLVNDVLLRGALSVVDSAFSALNTRTPPGVEQPTAATRSGSPDSLVSWETLGRQGREFVDGGPSPQELASAGTGSVRAPVRVYAGLGSASTAQGRADLAVAELERTGGFQRSVVLVVTATGSGWVNSAAANSLELMYAGDTAVVATQYSYLPSWVSFLVERASAHQEAQVLFDTVSARLEQEPEPGRPRLLVYGESLGAQASEHTFDSLADIRASTNGALWAGPPRSNEIWSSLVARRDPGSREIRPVYNGGAAVRFAGDRQDITQPPATWTRPRVLYLQHASDPIVWWSPDLLFEEPDWLEEPPGDDVLPAMSWYPVVTFWQVTVDLAHSKSVPDGHGHNYTDLILEGWMAVAPPAGWTEEDGARVRAVFAG